MAGSKNLAEDPYERLANAIVLQAVSDYRVALKKIKAHPKNREAISEALEIEKFFRSGWYSQLTDVDSSKEIFITGLWVESAYREQAGADRGTS